ncbi:MAG: hypothetical protein ACYCPN_04755, partial [Thermoplasmata archaeon]
TNRARVEETCREVETFCARLREGLDRLTFEERVKVVRWLIERVVVKDGEVTVEHIIPLTGRYRRDKERAEGPRPPTSNDKGRSAEGSVPSEQASSKGPFGGMRLPLGDPGAIPDPLDEGWGADDLVPQQVGGIGDRLNQPTPRRFGPASLSEGRRWRLPTQRKLSISRDVAFALLKLI